MYLKQDLEVPSSGTTSTFTNETYNENGTGILGEWEWKNDEQFIESSTVGLRNSCRLEMKEYAAPLAKLAVMMVMVEKTTEFEHWNLCVSDQVSHNCAFAGSHG